MIAVNEVTMRFGSRILFEDVTTTFMEGRRYAISGPNGAGKSTFMKILTGEQEPTKGNINRPKKMGILRQDQFAFDKFRVIDTVIMGNSILWKALEERDALYEQVRNHLAGLGDVVVALECQKDYPTAERMAIEFGEDFRLMTDLGWQPQDGRDTVELTMPPHENIVVSHSPSDDERRQHPEVAVKDAFAAARRQVDDLRRQN